MAVHSISENLLGLFLKRVCPACGAVRQKGEILCSWCLLRIRQCKVIHMSGTGLVAGSIFEGLPGIPDYASEGIPVYSAVEFAGLPGELLVRLKFEGEKHLATLAAELMYEYLPLLPGDGDTIVPIPASRRRIRERGYNQAALIAGRLARLTGSRVGRVLRREDAPSQVGLTTEERKRNVEGVFHTRGDGRITGNGTLWLLDDVATTFSTLHSAAGALLHAGAERVVGLTLAYRKKVSGSMIPKENPLS
jgi:ComF family protein